MEKSITTPDQYPLTLNALTNADNQKSSRDPVMNLQQGEVQRTMRILKEKFLVSIEAGSRSVEKYSQRFCNTTLSERQLDSAEYAIICLLILRGPQTPGELRSRSARLHAFNDNQEVADTLKTLMDCESGAMVARLPRKSGRQDHEYTHLFSGEVESVAEEAEVVQRVSTSGKAEARIDKLEARIDRLESELVRIAEQLGEEVDLGSEESSTFE